MRLEQHNKTIRLSFAALAMFVIVYFNLTPLASSDCWWHMKSAQYALEHGHPVYNDPFAIAGASKIKATYPSLLPGLLFLLAWKTWSFLGLNLLRIALASLFFALLIALARHAGRNHALVLLQVVILAFAMDGMFLLRPDMFNYILFALWCWLLARVPDDFGSWRSWLPLYLIECVWVACHPLFFYFGLCFGILTLAPELMQRRDLPTRTRLQGLAWLVAMTAAWLVNPLGWRALESFFVNVIRVDYHPESMRPFLQSLNQVNTYAYLLLVLIGLALGWRSRHETSAKWRFLQLFAVAALLAFVYSRCLPFPVIFLLIDQIAHRPSEPAAPAAAARKPAWAIVALALACLALVADRNQLYSARLVGWVNHAFRLNLSESYAPAGVHIFDIDRRECVQEAELLNRLRLKGNLITNHLGIASAALWLCPQLTPFWYGHAALINARVEPLRRFFIALENEDEAGVRQFLAEYAIQVVAMTGCSDKYRAHRIFYDRHLRLLYIDSWYAVFTRR